MTSMEREVVRVRFRVALMRLPGGVEWLTHVARLFDFREQTLGPGGFGLPRALAATMWRGGWR